MLWKGSPLPPRDIPNPEASAMSTINAIHRSRLEKDSLIRGEGGDSWRARPMAVSAAARTGLADARGNSPGRAVGVPGVGSDTMPLRRLPEQGGPSPPWPPSRGIELLLAPHTRRPVPGGKGRYRVQPGFLEASSPQEPAQPPGRSAAANPVGAGAAAQRPEG